MRIAVPVLCRSVKVSVNSRGPGAIAGGARSLTLSGEFILHVAWPTTANDFDTSPKQPHFFCVGFGIATVHPIAVAAEKRGPTRWAGQSSSSLSGPSASPIAGSAGVSIEPGEGAMSRR